MYDVRFMSIVMLVGLLVVAVFVVFVLFLLGETDFDAEENRS